MNTAFLIQLLVNGLVVGTLYGVVAMSFVLIYKATQVVNFAQGELLLIGAWVCWALLAKFQVPFWIGAALLVAGAFTLAGAFSSSAVCLALLCGLPLLLAGMLAVIVAWFARNGPWVHIRVKNDRPGEHNINFSVPLDLGVVAVRVAEPFVPQMRNTGVDDVILSMKDNVKKDQPLIIDVNDDEDGEHVQVIVG